LVRGGGSPSPRRGRGAAFAVPYGAFVECSAPDTWKHEGRIRGAQRLRARELLKTEWNQTATKLKPGYNQTATRGSEGSWNPWWRGLSTFHWGF